MGREVRKVPPHWDHPRNEHGHYQSMFDQTFASAVAEWQESKRKWDAGEDPDRVTYPGHASYEDWAGEAPDDPAYYRPWADHEATWFQLWETVSEGSPVTPPFATQEELVQYLAKHGDEWDERGGNRGWGLARARAFVEAGWAPSMMIVDGKIYESKDIPLATKNKT